MTTLTITGHSVSVQFPDDAEPVAARTPSGGKDRTIRPVRGTITAHSGKIEVRMWGPQVKADGSETASHFEAGVRVGDEGWSFFPKAPQWLADAAMDALP